MKITIYDGATTIGGNKIYVEEREKGVFLDFGMNFAKHGQYYDEFLRERSSRGIYDAVQLGIIPRLNVYKEELVPIDLDVSAFPRPDVSAVFLSHAHLILIAIPWVLILALNPFNFFNAILSLLGSYFLHKLDLNYSKWKTDHEWFCSPH